ncbi:MAG: hypothetical protein MUE96_09845 [Bacteroidia bacterium]|nr:hypothetical protein [Bacteroidia bacterium]
MKKMNLALAVVFAAAITFTSCKKDYTCTCKISGAESKSELKDAKKGDAEDACKALETTGKLVDPAAKCTLD